MQASGNILRTLDAPTKCLPKHGAPQDEKGLKTKMPYDKLLNDKRHNSWTDAKWTTLLQQRIANGQNGLLNKMQKNLRVLVKNVKISKFVILKHTNCLLRQNE